MTPHDPEPPLTGEPNPDLLQRFMYHPPKDWQKKAYSSLRAQALLLATEMSQIQPPSRELSLAITKLEEAIMWANAGIARHT